MNTWGQLQGLIVFGLALALTSATLVLAHAVHLAPPAVVEVSLRWSRTAWPP